MDTEIKEYLKKLIEKQTEEIKKYIDEKIELLEDAIEDISCEADSDEKFYPRDVTATSGICPVCRTVVPAGVKCCPKCGMICGANTRK